MLVSSFCGVAIRNIQGITFQTVWCCAECGGDGGGSSASDAATAMWPASLSTSTSIAASVQMEVDRCLDRSESGGHRLSSLAGNGYIARLCQRERVPQSVPLRRGWRWWCDGSGGNSILVMAVVAIHGGMPWGVVVMAGW